jgi:O-succinylhomoserine sulfhydrylase
MATNKKPGNWRKRTLAVRGGTMRTPFQETSEALFLTSGYAYEEAQEAEARFKGESPGFQYSRFGNPTVAMFEARMAALEGAPAARATATGMAAISSALLCYLKAGDHVVAAKAMFGSCRYVVESVLSRFGITSTLVDGEDPAAWEKAVTKNTKMFFLETPSNPVLTIVDLKAVSKIADAHGILVVVDNAMASPAVQRPMEFGAHIVAYSSTKYIDGQGRVLGGVVLGPQDFVDNHLQPFIRNTGPSISPFNAWVHLKSLETLDLRMRAHCESAYKVAEFLSGQKKVAKVHYPFLPSHPQHNLAKAQMDGGGGVVTFELAGGKDAAFKLANALGLVDISNNFGDVKSLLTHPETTTHQKVAADARLALGITPGLVRLSVGLEDAEDICDDLAQALKVA